MSRVFQRLLRKGALFVCAAAASAGLLASSAEAQNNVSFGMRPRYNGVPGAGSNIVFYNLPASGSIYAGPVNSSFDLTAQVSGSGTETAAAFGLIATVSGTGQVVFNPPAIVGDANNLGNATNPSPSFPINSSFDMRFANTGVNNPSLGNREIDIIALEQVALQNNTVTNGDGIASIPVQIAAGATGSYTVAFNVSTNYTGFVKTISQDNTQFLTNPGAFPHAGGTIEVRRSRKADMNGDGNINSADIGGFIVALNGVANFSSQFPWLQAGYISDLNEDGNTNSADIGGFIAQLNNPSPSPSAVPEPSSLALLAIAGIAAAGAYARRRRVTRS
jgi:hypothetical protein